MSRGFFAISISSLSAFQEGSRERSSALMARQALCWPRFRGQPPEPAGSRRKARGVDGESARRATIIAGHYAANITALLLILFPRSDYVCSIDPRRSPLRCSNSLHQLISGRNRVRTKIPHASLRGQRAPRGMGPFYRAASFSHVRGRSHIHLGFGKFSFRWCSDLCADVF